MNRRSFIANSLTCCAHVYGIAKFAPATIRSVFAPQDENKLVVKEPWGQIEKIADGVWSLISTPFATRDFTTVCNGGIVAGEKGVLAIECYMQPKGATWIAEQAKKLTGKWPTDVVSTHFHGDHTSGHKGYFQNGEKPRVWLTDSTRNAAEKSFANSGKADNAFENVSTIALEKGTELDLGNRKVKLVNRSGHTNSDVTIEVVDPKVVWCGDLFFNRMFPNYGDATPSKLETYVDSIKGQSDVVYVPGHGPIADKEAIKSYKELLLFVKDSAKRAFDSGREVGDATKEFKLPNSLKDWTIWSPDNAKRAFNAWYKELKKD